MPDIVFARKTTPKPSQRVLDYLETKQIATFGEISEFIPREYFDSTLTTLETQGKIRFLPGFPKRIELVRS